MQFVEALMLYYNSSGDASFLAEAFPALRAQMAWFAARVTRNNSATANTSGLLLAREYSSFDDPLAYVTTQGAALNAFYFKALRDAAAVAEVVGAGADAAAWVEAAAAFRVDSAARVTWEVWACGT